MFCVLVPERGLPGPCRRFEHASADASEVCVWPQKQLMPGALRKTLREQGPKGADTRRLGGVGLPHGFCT